MAYTFSTTETWSRTYARYVAGKVAADLRQLQQQYGEPADERIEDYLRELTELLAGGYIREVTYGYKRDGAWVVALRYTADMNGNLSADDRSGRIPRGADLREAAFHSFLALNERWSARSLSELQAIERRLPFVRSSGVEPAIRSGAWYYDKTYSSAGCGLRRATIGGAL